MFAFRTTHGPADLAFTDRCGGVSAPPYDELNLSLAGGDDQGSKAENHRRVLAEFAPYDRLFDVHQVHGASVDVLEERRFGSRPEADAIITSSPGKTVMVRAADCVPVILVAADARLVGAAHCGRAGLVAGVVSATVLRLRELGASDIEAWLGPHVCGRCYEVPDQLRSEVTATVPAAYAETSWGTASVDLAAGLTAQLGDLDVAVHDVGRCTVESPDLYSYRRDGARSGRQAGLVRLRRETG